MDIGDYVTSILDVPEGDVTTAATWAAVLPGGATANGSGSQVVDATKWSAIIGPVTAKGWGLTTWTVTGAGAGQQRSRWFVAASPTAWGVWPPSLEDLKLDMGRDQQQGASDQELTQVLDAAVAFVVDRKSWKYDLGVEPVESSADLIAPTYTLILGTLRLAGRWHVRRRSPDGMINMGEQGNQRVSSGDADIDRMLKLGRYAEPVWA